MMQSPGHNFAGRLVGRLGQCSCLIDGATGETIHSADLPRLISNFATGLLGAGLKAGERILIGCTLSPPTTIAYLGAMYAGMIPIPVGESVLVSSLPALLKRTNARAVWTETNLQIEKIADADVLALHGRTAQSGKDPIPPAPRALSDLATLMATSGTLGPSRFVMVSHENLIANTEAIIKSQNLQSDDRAMVILPLSYCFGASVVHTHLYQGGGVVFDHRFMFPDKVLRAINEYQCTTFAGVPTVYNILLSRSNIRSIPMPTLRRFLQAGGALGSQQVSRIRAAVPTAKFFVMYGQTEATARISCLDPEHLDEKLGSAGRPLENLQVRIIDENGSELPLGEVGEIIVKGPSITLGYLNEAQENHRIFKDGWLRTGDVGHLDGDGYIWISGRKSAFVKMRGVRVSFAEVENKVAAVPGVYECAAAAIPHSEVGEALVLYVVPEKESCDVIERVRRSLPLFWTCASINLVSEIPKTAHGKVARAALGMQVD